MAQEKPPLWSNLSNSQYISIWETTASKGHTNFKEALLRLRRERNKALLECRKVTCSNTFHELTQQFQWWKGQDLSVSVRWLKLEWSLQKQGLRTHLFNAEVPGWGWRIVPPRMAHPLHYHGRPDVSGRIQCRTAALPSHAPISLPPPCHIFPQTNSWFPAALSHKNPALVSDLGSIPQTKVLCYSTNEPPPPFPLSPQLWVSVEHYWGGVLVCRLGHMTEDIFFCYNAKEAPEKDKWKIGINPRRKKIIKQNKSVAKSFLLTGIEQK